jgi:hypothetical protein
MILFRLRDGIEIQSLIELLETATMFAMKRMQFTEEREHERDMQEKRIRLEQETTKRTESIELTKRVETEELTKRVEKEATELTKRVETEELTKRMETEELTKRVEKEATELTKRVELDAKTKQLQFETERKIIEIKDQSMVQSLKHQLVQSTNQKNVHGTAPMGRELANQKKRQFAFTAVATGSYVGKLVVQCFNCKGALAFFFSCKVYSMADGSVRVYCKWCNHRQKDGGYLLHASRMDTVRLGTWLAQYGMDMVGECSACKSQVEFLNFHCAHEIAKHNNGASTIENMWVSCMHCNTSSQQFTFSEVIQSLGFTPKPRANAHMIYHGLKWVKSVKKPDAGACPFSTDVFPTHLRYPSIVL